MKESRNMLGFTLEQMASFLGISKSTVSMYENGQRRLPPNAREKMGKILEMLNKNETQPIVERASYAEEKGSANLQKKLKYIISDANLAILKGEKQIDILNRCYAETSKALNLIKYIRQDVDPTTNPAERSHLILAENKCYQKLDACGIDIRMLLEFDMVVNKFKLEKATALLRENNLDGS